MASGLSKRCLTQLTPSILNSSSFLAPNAIQVRTITRKELRDPDRPKYAPWPYKTKQYTYWHAFFDDVTHRINDDSRVIVVDGPPTGNKDALCKSIADALDFHYIPSPHLDAVYVNIMGFDKRTMNYKMPPIARSWDIHQFMQKPGNILSSKMQWHYFNMRLLQYFDCMAHLLNTGQGVVMHRSIWSDRVFAKTLTDMGWIRPDVYDHIVDQTEAGTFECMKPHTLVYLDMTPETIIKNAKARNVNNEVGSEFFSEKCLNTLIKNYKDHYLEKMSINCEVMVYDWNEEGCHDDVIDDICDVDLNVWTKFDKKLYDWNVPFFKEWDWKGKRLMFSSHIPKMLGWANNVKVRDIPEVVYPLHIYDMIDAATANEPTMNGERGNNPKAGDSYPWFR